MIKKLLLVFCKNFELGKVKTRLASSIGEEKALEIYRELIQKTKTTIRQVPVTKHIYYSSFIDQENDWGSDVSKKIQEGVDLGERMKNAFEEGFNLGFQQIVIIGTDLWDLTVSDIQNAFDALNKHDTVIGPATDGGYYLLGMTELIPQLFLNKKWSTSSVLTDTLLELKQCENKILDEKNDIDTIEDLAPFPELLTLVNQK